MIIIAIDYDYSLSIYSTVSAQPSQKDVETNVLYFYLLFDLMVRKCVLPITLILKGGIYE